MFSNNNPKLKILECYNLTKCWKGVVENPQFSHIDSLREIQDLVGIVYLNFVKWKNCLYKKFGS